MAGRLSILNPEPKTLSGPDLLHDLVPHPADEDRVAIEYLDPAGERQLITYQQLHARSGALARLLRRQWDQLPCPRPSRFIVPLLIEQCPDLYITQLAILKAGGAFCPVPLDAPAERIRFICQDVGGRVFLTTKQLREQVPPLETIAVLAVDDISLYLDEEDGPVSLSILPSQSAYCMYTSGSTGQPKGVLVSHSAATQALLAHGRHIPSFSRFLNFANPTFDVSVFEIFFTFFRNATLICGQRRKLLSDLPGFINSMRVDAAELTPSVASSLLRQRHNVPGLKLLLTIGEMLKQDVVEEFGASSPDTSILYGMYGPTEAAIHCTLQTACPSNMSVRNIGIPLDTVSAFIVRPRQENEDANGNIEILPWGEEGELAVGGAQLADGYLNRPEQTQAAFVSHSHYGRLYRTGDRARMFDSGTLECLGRISGGQGQVKLRGQRIELGEIEYAASRTKGCQTVVADVIDGALVVFCVDETKTVTIAQVQETCKHWLPSFMIPVDGLVLDALPYLDSGKADRKTLRALYTSTRSTANGSAGEMSGSMRKIVETLSTVLRTSVTPQTRFAGIGLDSLTSIRAASALSQAGLAHLDATDIMECDSPQELERLLEQLNNRTDQDAEYEELLDKVIEAVKTQAEADIHFEEIEEMYPATPIQSAMLGETEKHPQAYCNWVELAIPAEYSSEYVEGSLQALAYRHSLLRSGFVAISNPPIHHAVVVWRRLQPWQLQWTTDLDEKRFQEYQLPLHPSSIQIHYNGNCYHVRFRLHHSLYDQWSVHVLRQDLNAILEGRTLPTPLSFSAFTQFVLQYSNSDEANDDLEFWDQYMRDFSPTLLPAMNDKQEHRRLARTPWLQLDIDILSLSTNCTKAGYSNATAFQAAVTYLFSGLLGATDITYGMVYSGRNLPIPEMERIFGPCLSTLPFRIDLSTIRTHADLLRLIKNTNHSVQAHGLTPLSLIKAASAAAPESVLFDILFVWQETTLQDDDLRVREMNSADNSEFKLVVEVEPSGKDIQARITFAEHLISRSQVELLLKQLAMIAQHLVSDPTSLIEHIPDSLPAALLSITNPEPSFCSPGHDLLGPLEATALSHPECPALLFTDRFTDSEVITRTITYAEFNARADAFADVLLSAGAQAEDLIMICMNKSPELYVAIITSQKIGAGYLPILPDTPKARVDSILAGSGVKLCVHDSSSMELFKYREDIMRINVEDVDWSNLVHARSKPKAPPSAVAYTVYTSGTTGEPKGVAVTRANLLGNIQALAEIYPVKPGDRLLQACSQAFDVSVFEIFFAFYTGMCLCSGTKDVMFQDLEATITAMEVTHLSLTPTVAALVHPSNVPAVKFLVTAGEGVTEKVHRTWAGKGLHQGYGPSETTNICTVNMNVDSADAIGNIGPPLRNTSAFVISPRKLFQPLPSGAIGEFVFGGEQVFAGYIGREDLNAEKIIEHPYYGRLYRSGDIGRILPDGSLLISGRVDEQVKIRGNRIELGEINSVLLKQDCMHDCATLVVGEDASSQALVTFVVPSSAADGVSSKTEILNMEERFTQGLQESLESSLPRYMVPAKIVAVSRLPRTSQGKLDRPLLRRLYNDLPQDLVANADAQMAADDEALSQTEHAVAEALAETLNRPMRSLSQNRTFYSYGLNSLNAIAMAKALRSKLEYSIQTSMILRHSTIKRLARHVDSRRASGSETDHLDIDLLPPDLVQSVRAECETIAGPIEAILPCTPLQEAMLAASGSYCNTTTFKISGDAEELLKCWKGMTCRHGILRTRFVQTEHASHPYVQVISKNSEHTLGCEEQHWAPLSDERTPAVDALHPFKLFVQKNDGEVHLKVIMHHAIYDGVAIALLLSEIESFYHGDPLPPPVPFAPFLFQTQQHCKPSATQFWSRQLSNFVPKPFPILTISAQTVQLVITEQDVITISSVAAFSRKHSVTPHAIFQAALAKTLSICQSSDDVCFGDVWSGRTVDLAHIDRLVAPCFNTAPNRVRLDSEQSNMKLIGMLGKHNVDVKNYQLTPLRRLQTLSKRPDLHLFDCILILQPPKQPLDNSIWELIDDSGAMDIPLVVEIVEGQERYDAKLIFSPQYMSEGFAASFAKGFSSALKSCLDFPYSSVDHMNDFDQKLIAGLLVPAGSTATGSYSCINCDGLDDTINEQESIVRQTFASLAKTELNAVGSDTPMYQIGLDSLNAAQIATKLRAQGLNVDVADVMECLTPRAIARLACSRTDPIPPERQSTVDLDGFDRRHRNTILDKFELADHNLEAVWPCTAVQAGMLTQSMQSRGRLYINHIAYEVPHEYNSEHLAAAWRRVAERHQILRMGFHEIQDVDSSHAMSILAPSIPQLPFHTAQPRLSLADIEKQATHRIIKALKTRAWCVTVQHDADGIMMVLSLHHALYDATSLRLIMSDFLTALEDGHILPSPSIRATLTDTLSAAEDPDSSAKHFWAKALEGTRRPTVVHDGQLSAESTVLDVSLLSLEKFCRRYKATIQSLGQTVVARLLSAYIGEPNVVFGTIFSSATSPHVAFPNISMVPVACGTHEDSTKVLQHMVTYNAAAHRYRHTPLADIQRYASHSGEQLFDVVFSYHKPMEADRGTEWRVIRESANVDYTLSIEMEVNADRSVQLQLTYNSGCIPQDQARIMLKQYNHLLYRLVYGNEVESVSLYSMKPPKEERLPTSSHTLHGLFEDSVRRFPDRTALEFTFPVAGHEHTTRIWTYRELNSAAEKVASLLHNRRVRPGSVVAVAMDKCAEASFAFLGILKAGCSFLAVDPDLPAARKQFISEDSGAQLLLTSREDDEVFGVPTVKLTERLLQNEQTQTSDGNSVDEQNVCYVLYTSGTTGTPKGCEITHENAVQAMMAFQRLFEGRWAAGSRWLQFASYWFDVSVLEQFWSWSVGITVVGAPRDLVLEDIAGFIDRYNISHIDLTPSLARLVNPEDVPSLCGGVFITGGEALKQEIVNTWGKRKTICNGYGPTEATIGVTMNPFIGPDAKPSNIGKQFDNVGTLVLQPGSDDPVLRGAVGELCVFGKLVGKGYLNRLELTERAFPYLPTIGQRIYRTGDLVRMLADGSFSFIGRKEDDSQKKLRGQRLETSEIDSVIVNALQDVTHSVSLVAASEVVHKEVLVTFFTTNGASGKTYPELEIDRSHSLLLLASRAKEACAGTLPGYMIPTYILPINFLPLTVNNKVDFKRLVALFTKSSLQDLQRLQPVGDQRRDLTEDEKKIQRVLVERLGIKESDVLPSSNIFSLGLSSISAVPFATSLKGAGFKTATVAVVLSNPTVNNLTTALTRIDELASSPDDAVEQAELSMTAFHRRHRSTAAQALGCPLSDLEVAAPCSPLQEGLILESLRNDERPYFNTFCYDVSGADLSRLKDAIERLVAHVQILRAAFFQTSDGFAQAIRKRSLSLVEVVELEGKTVSKTLREKKEKWLSTNAPTILSPFQVVLTKSYKQQMMIIFAHHAIYDGISFDRVLHALAEIYRGNEAVDCRPDFTAALLCGPLRTVNGAESFWREHLTRHSYFALPYTGSAGEDVTAADHVVHDTSKLETIRKALGASHQAVVQACFEIAMVKQCPPLQTYGMVISGRAIELEGADRVLGPMFNTLPQALLIQPQDSLNIHIKKRHEANVRMIPLQHTPLRDIRKWCGQYPGDPLFDVLFVFQHHPDAADSMWEETFKPIDNKPRAEYPLAFEAELGQNGLKLTLVAKGIYFDHSDLQELLDTFQQVLAAAPSDQSLHEQFGIELHQSKAHSAFGETTAHLNGIYDFKWTDRARAVRGIIAEASKAELDDIDEHTSLLALGIDSIDSIRILSRLKKAGIYLTISQLLKAQTTARIVDIADREIVTEAAKISRTAFENLRRQLRSNILPNLVNKDDVEDVKPATPGQEALMAEMLRIELREYFNHDVLKFRRDVDVHRLEKAWQTVIEGSPILRTVFVEVTAADVDAVYAQVILKKWTPSLQNRQVDDVHKLDALFEEIRADVLEEIETTPPLRLVIVRAGQEQYLVLSIAHALYDGTSIELLHEDIKRAYNHCFRARPSYDGIIDEALAANSEEALQFWAGHLSGAEPCYLPSKTTRENRTRRAELPLRIRASQLHQFCRTHNISMQALAQTCWAFTLAHYARSTDVLFGVVLACRDADEAQEMMFPMMNTIAVRSSLHGSRLEMLRDMQALMTETLSYKRTPLRTIQAAAGAKGNLFDSLFIYQKTADKNEGEEEVLYDSVGGSADTEYPVAVEIEEAAGKMVWRTACKDSVLDEQGTDALLRDLDSVMKAIMKDVDKPTVEFVGGKMSICGLEAFVPAVKGSENDSRADQDEHEAAPSVGEEENREVVKTILEALAQVAKVPITELNRTTTIETIGIDSISAIKLAAVLRMKDLKITVSELLRAKTAAAIAEAAKTKETGGSSPLARSADEIVEEYLAPIDMHNVLIKAGIEAGRVEKILPATAGQVYMLNMWRKSAGKLFFATFEYEVMRQISQEQIQKAWKDVIKTHPVLRTVFVATSNDTIPILQVVLREPTHEVGKQPMVSFQPAENDKGWKFQLQIHHALYDAVSLHLLIEDLQRLLASQSLPVPFLTYADFLAHTLSPHAISEGKAFWMQYLRHTKPMQLPQPVTDGPQERVEIFHPSLVNHARRLVTLAKRVGVSSQALLFAAYAKLYATLSSTAANTKEMAEGNDVVLGIYLSNRSHLTGLEKLAAPTLNLVPMLVRSPRRRSVLELARAVHEDLQEIGTQTNSAAGLWEVEEWTGVSVDTFVNFVRVPGNDEESEIGGADEAVVIREVVEKRLQERRRVVETEGMEFEDPEELRGLKKIAGAYKHSIDIEMVFREGQLDVGLFCPETMMTLEQAADVVQEFKKTLDGMIEGVSA